MKDGRKWISFPSKETGVDENGKKKYWPHLRFRTRESMDNFSKACIEVIDEEIAKTSVHINIDEAPSFSGSTLDEVFPQMQPF